MNSCPIPNRILAILLALSLSAPQLYASSRQTPNPGPHHIFAPYFRVGQGYQTTILVRNRHINAPASITPIVHTAQGADLRLPTVQMAANSTHAISIEDELRAAGAWVDSGAVTLEYIAANPSVINAQLTVKNTALGIIFDLPFQPGVSKTPKPSTTLTAPFWFREDHMSARLVLLNTTDAPATVNPTVLANGQAHPSQTLAVGPHQSLDVDLRQIVGAGSIQGMLSLMHSGSAGAIYPALLFSDEQNGYSLTTRFTWPMAMDQSSPETKPTASYHLPGIMINAQDPKLGFRRDLQFKPYALLGNTTLQPLAITLKASFDSMDGTGLQHADLPVLSLAPLETRLVDFSQFTKSHLLPASIMDFTLEMSHTGMMGEMVFQVFSVDQTGNFVFNAEAHVNPSFRSDFVYWSTEGSNDTMLSIENVSDEDVAVRVTIGFNDGAGTYRFAPVTIPRKATMGLDLKQLIAQATQPDDKGNKIPAGANFGGLRVETADELLNEHIIVTTSIYDPISGTCGGGCVICNGVSSFDLAANPLVGVVLSRQQVTATVVWDDGSTTDATLNTTFSSSNASAISVTSTPGTSGNGMATFNADGTSTISGRLFVSGEPAGEPVPECPTSCPRTILTGQAPGTVQIPTSLSLVLEDKVSYNGSNMIECNGTNDGLRWGYSRCGTYTLLDQHGKAITIGSFKATEIVSTVSSNPSGLKARVGGGQLVNGQFQDFWAFVATSSPAPPPGEFVKSRQRIAIISQNGDGTPYNDIRINCLDFESTDVTATDITKSGSCQ